MDQEIEGSNGGSGIRGRATVIGVAGGDIDEMHRSLDTGRLDVLLNHSWNNLLDRSADWLIDHAIDAGVSHVNAAPYASGMLAKPLSSRPHFQYRPPSPDVIARTAWLRTTWASVGAQILKPAATLQWGGYGGTFADPDGHHFSIERSRLPVRPVRRCACSPNVTAWTGHAARE